MRTIPQLFEDSYKLFPNNALIYETKGGKYQTLSYQDIHHDVILLSSALIGLEIKKGDRVALLSEGCSSWLKAEMSVLYLGAISVPLSTKINQDSDLIFRLQHSGSSVIFVSSAELSKIRKIKKSLPELQHIIVFDPVSELEKNELDFKQVLDDGKDRLPALKQEITDRWKSVQEDDLANISYTSGTTADPKGIMLTHCNYITNVEQAHSLFEVPEWYTTLLILSWDHSFAHTVGLYVLMKNGASISVVDPGKSPMERLRNIPKNIRETKPVFLLSVPAMARSFRKNIESAVRSKGKLTERLFKSALKTAYFYHGDGWSNKSLSRTIIKPLIWLYDNILFSKIRDNFGGRLAFMIGGGALLDIELQRFYYAIGIPMFQGYGLTEAAPIISSNTPTIHKLGTSGRIVKQLEVKILDEKGNLCATGTKGEIVVKGENVMKGYWKNVDATNESLKNGWLHTGDLGYFDNDGFLVVLGRFKSLLIGNDGEKYSPEGMEEAIVDHSKFIDQCMLYNNQNSYTIALIVPSKPALKKYVKSKDINTADEKVLNRVLKLIKSEVDQFQSGGRYENMFPERWLPSAIAILNEPFSEENGMINSTMKMVRSKVEDYHKETIEFLYKPEGKSILNTKNLEIARQILENDKYDGSL